MNIKEELKKLADPERAKVSQRFSKTGPGEYGEGDVFIGVKVPELRRLAKKYREIKVSELVKLLRSQIHEERLLAFLIMVLKFQTGREKEKKEIYNLYLKNTRYVNNWDLVDSSAGKIAGEYLFKKSKNVLFKLAKSKNIWERRIAIVATSNFIKKDRFQETLKIARILLEDKEDLIHKAAGWMLREVGKRDLGAEEAFLEKHYQTMSRTMLRYATERFPKRKRKDYN